MATRWGNSDGLLGGGPKITADGACSHEIKMLAPLNRSYDKPRQNIKKQRHHFADKGLPSQSYGFSSSHVWIWELDHKEGWALKNQVLSTVVLEKTLESPLDSKEINRSVLKEMNPEYSLEGLMLKWHSNTLATWWKANSLEKTLTLAEGEGGSRQWDGYMASLTPWTRIWANLRRHWRTGKLGALRAPGSQPGRT